MKDGEYQGVKCVQLSDDHDSQKSNDLTLENHTVAKESNKACHVPFPQTPDPLCLYNLLSHLIFEYLPPDASDGRILRRKASAKQLKVSVFNVCLFVRLNILCF